MWIKILSFLYIVDILNLSLSSKAFNKIWKMNIRFQNTKKISNVLVNKDKDMRIFICSILHEFFELISEKF